MAQPTITTVITAIATNHWRLDGEHGVHVVDSDGEYPRWHTEQSVLGAHAGRALIGGRYIYCNGSDSNVEVWWLRQRGVRLCAKPYIGVQMASTVHT